MRILNDKYTWKKYPAYAHVEDPLKGLNLFERGLDTQLLRRLKKIF